MGDGLKLPMAFLSVDKEEYEGKSSRRQSQFKDV